MLVVLRVSLLSICAFLFSCAQNSAGFGERDKYVVSTPKYYDNRVFYIAPDTSTREWALEGAMAARERLIIDDKSRISHGSPLTVILNSISMPSSYSDNDSNNLKDIAVVLDISARVSGASESIVAWYQRGVRVDQSLNFSNLLIYFDPRWDARVAPLIRIRVVDVTSEKNAETREALTQIGQFINSVGPILPTSSGSILSVAARAATLILNRPNEQMLDYSVQFYSEEQLAESYGADLTPLKRGRVLLIGRPLGENSAFWKTFQGYYDGDVLSVYSNDKIINSPVAVLTVSTAQVIVPAIVSSRSDYLQKLLSDSQQSDISAVREAGRSIWSGVRTYALIEELRRSRDGKSLLDVVSLFRQDNDELSAVPEDKSLLRQTIKDVSDCFLGTDQAINDWWDTNVGNIKFQKDDFKLEGETCPD